MKSEFSANQAMALQATASEANTRMGARFATSRADTMARKAMATANLKRYAPRAFTPTAGQSLFARTAAFFTRG